MATPPLSISFQSLSSNEFELLCRDVLKEKYNIEFKQYGRNGQAQNGIDLRAEVEDNLYIIAQCKNYSHTNKAGALIKEMESDIDKANKQQKMEIKKLFLMTSYPRDTKIQDSVTDWRKKYPFEIDILFREDIEEIIKNNSILKENPEENLITLFEFAFKGIQFSHIIFSKFVPFNNILFGKFELLHACRRFQMGKVYISDEVIKNDFSRYFEEVYNFISDLDVLEVMSNLINENTCRKEFSYCEKIEYIIKNDIINSLPSQNQQIIFLMGMYLGQWNKILYKNTDLDLTKAINKFKNHYRKLGFTDEQKQEIEKLLEPILRKAPNFEEEKDNYEIDKQCAPWNVYDYICDILLYQDI